MNRVIRIREAKERVRVVKKNLAITLSPEERVKIFANLIIDRIFEEQSKGTLSNLIKKG